MPFKSDSKTDTQVQLENANCTQIRFLQLVVFKYVNLLM